MSDQMDEKRIEDMVKRIIAGQCKKTSQPPQLGVMKIDVSAVYRILTWSIEQAEEQLMNLRCARDVLEAAVDRKSKRH